MAGATPPAAHTRMLALTPALSAAIRSSYYDAYRANPDPLSAFGARAGLPESAVFGPQLLHAGELLATTPAEASSWVVASVCIGSRVGCQDAGAFQVFDRTGLSGEYYLDGFDPCLVPEPLAQIWFPGGRGPLGTHCPAAGELVPRTSLRTGAWTALLPQSWRRVGCQTASQALARQLLCSSLGGDTDIDVWYDPADVGERFVVVTCRGGGCSPLAPAGGPEINRPPGARVLARSRESLSFVVPSGAGSAQRLTEGTGTIRGLILAARFDGSPTYPLLTVTISLPASQSGLAEAILRSFVSPPTGP